MRFPLIVTFLLGGILAWALLTDQTLRSAAIVLLPALWGLLISLWWALRARGRRLRRLAVVVLGIVAVVLFFRFAVRYEGSADGSAFPQLAFVWQPKDQPHVAALPKTAPVADLAPAPAGAQDMPRFLGEKGDGVLPAVTFQTDWKAHPPREVWRVPVGAGWSGFAVAGNRAITQEQRGPQECVVCYELSSGRVLWSHAVEAFFTEMLGGEGPRATPTIVAAAGVVFTLGATGWLHCLDLATGTVKWQAEVLKDAKASKNLEWGKSASPLLTAAHVICSGGEDGAQLVAYERVSGKLAWTSGSDGGSYASPVLLHLDGRDQIVTVNRHSASGHDPATGKELWHFDWPGMFPKVGQPIAINDHEILITSSYGVKSHRLDIHGGQVRVVWAESSPRTKFSSASIVGDYAYGLDEGTLCCVNLADGNRVWREGRYNFGQQVRVGADLLLIQAEKGPCVLVHAQAAGLDEIARLDALHSKTWNPPTLAGRYLLLRNDREAVCYELVAK